MVLMDAYIDNLYLGAQGAIITYIVLFLYFWLIKKRRFVSLLDPKLIGVIILGTLVITAFFTVIEL
ncbi:hypothetical protein [Brevibacillus brevis]|uniref:hypothetical protein n=1 Tax=Brevibacillus brevis TaxID=1393 RepID=UPI001C8D0985|nr:hypothetical protein [Brevibacillus brevis]MBY0085794.1 hypothetical protein [Brevibacillus brevis]